MQYHLLITHIKISSSREMTIKTYKGNSSYAALLHSLEYNQEMMSTIGKLRLVNDNVGVYQDMDVFTPLFPKAMSFQMKMVTIGRDGLEMPKHK